MLVAGHYYLISCTAIVFVLAVCASIIALNEWTSARSTIYATTDGTRNSDESIWNISIADKCMIMINNLQLKIKMERLALQRGFSINERITTLLLAPWIIEKLFVWLYLVLFVP